MNKSKEFGSSAEQGGKAGKSLFSARNEWEESSDPPNPGVPRRRLGFMGRLAAARAEWNPLHVSVSLLIP